MSNVEARSGRPPAMRWEAPYLYLLDQRRLPHTCDTVTCRTPEEVADAIRSMVVRGAPAIGAAAAYGVAMEALRLRELDDADSFWRRLESVMRELVATRPTAVNLAWAIERMGERARSMRSQGPAAVARELELEAAAIAQEDVETNLAIGRHGAALVPTGAGVLTHCNTGALATVDYGTAIGVIRVAHEEGKGIHVYAGETRPFLQGARLTAWELQQDGIPVTLIADSAAGAVMSRGAVDLVIVGADRVTANGDVVNKIGTYALAVLAQAHGIPFYVAAPRTTIDLRTATGADVTIEERDGREVTHIGDVAIAPEGVNVYNPAFDVTPASLVTALVTELGVVRPPYPEALRRLFEAQHDIE